MLRKMAGRPTSADLQAMRIEIIEEGKTAAEEAARQKKAADSAAMAVRMAERSAFVLDSLKASGSIITPGKLGGIDSSDLESSFYIIVGAFRDRSNAARMTAKVEEAGYPARIISLKTGMHAVGICESDDAVQVSEWLKKVRLESFCPKEAWVLVKE